MCVKRKKPVPTEEDLKEMQAMNELLEKVRQWEKYYWANETAERIYTDFLNSIGCICHLFFSANYWTVVFFLISFHMLPCKSATIIYFFIWNISAYIFEIVFFCKFHVAKRSEQI